MIDFSLNTIVPIITNDVDLILQQIELLFDTNPGEVLGHPEFGSKYDKYLWDLKLTNYELETAIRGDLNNLEMLGFSHDVEVLLLQGTEEDIALIKITLSRDDENYEKIYKIR